MTKFKTLAAVLLAVSCLGVTAAYAQMKPQIQEQIVQNYDQIQKNKQLQTCFSASRHPTVRPLALD